MTIDANYFRSHHGHFRGSCHTVGNPRHYFSTAGGAIFEHTTDYQQWLDINDGLLVHSPRDTPTPVHLVVSTGIDIPILPRTDEYSSSSLGWGGIVGTPTHLKQISIRPLTQSRSGRTSRWACRNFLQTLNPSVGS